MNSPERACHLAKQAFGVAYVGTKWGRNPFSYGAYSYVAVGTSGKDYDILGIPVDNCLFFAGEATCQEQPDIVGRTMMSGLREAVSIIDVLSTRRDYIAEVEALEATQRQLDIETNEVRDIIKKLDAVRLPKSSVAKSIYEMLEVNRIQEEWKISEEDLPPPKPPDLNWRVSPRKRSITTNNSSLTSTLRTRLILRGGVTLGIKEGA
ncbi:hypothetical protein V8G54_029286 [Vigna mungo]|uniref:Amine oxidase domain-containing protein n=1 Tax=Vigna mungo TaxID=3915 RepID=A0AAQ3RMH1_VIGMU